RAVLRGLQKGCTFISPVSGCASRSSRARLLRSAALLAREYRTSTARRLDSLQGLIAGKLWHRLIPETRDQPLSGGRRSIRHGCLCTLRAATWGVAQRA